MINSQTPQPIQPQPQSPPPISPPPLKHRNPPLPPSLGVISPPLAPPPPLPTLPPPSSSSLSPPLAPAPPPLPTLPPPSSSSPGASSSNRAAEDLEGRGTQFGVPVDGSVDGMIGDLKAMSIKLIPLLGSSSGDSRPIFFKLLDLFENSEIQISDILDGIAGGSDLTKVLLFNSKNTDFQDQCITFIGENITGFNELSDFLRQLEKADSSSLDKMFVAGEVIKKAEEKGFETGDFVRVEEDDHARDRQLLITSAGVESLLSKAISKHPNTEITTHNTVTILSELRSHFTPEVRKLRKEQTHIMILENNHGGDDSCRGHFMPMLVRYDSQGKASAVFLDSLGFDTTVDDSSDTIKKMLNKDDDVFFTSVKRQNDLFGCAIFSLRDVSKILETGADTIFDSINRGREDGASSDEVFFNIGHNLPPTFWASTQSSSTVANVEKNGSLLEYTHTPKGGAVERSVSDTVNRHMSGGINRLISNRLIKYTALLIKDLGELEEDGLAVSSLRLPEASQDELEDINTQTDEIVALVSDTDIGLSRLQKDISKSDMELFQKFLDNLDLKLSKSSFKMKILNGDLSLNDLLKAAVKDKLNDCIHLSEKVDKLKRDIIEFLPSDSKKVEADSLAQKFCTSFETDFKSKVVKGMEQYCHLDKAAHHIQRTHDTLEKLASLITDDYKADMASLQTKLGVFLTSDGVKSLSP